MYHIKYTKKKKNARVDITDIQKCESERAMANILNNNVGSKFIWLICNKSGKLNRKCWEIV